MFLAAGNHVSVRLLMLTIKGYAVSCKSYYPNFKFNFLLKLWSLADIGSTRRKFNSARNFMAC